LVKALVLNGGLSVRVTAPVRFHEEASCWLRGVGESVRFDATLDEGVQALLTTGAMLLATRGVVSGVLRR
tara:strand:+ start:550 stop:759 length:210 start_codon:yes stop_codon:yes gene_type:complete